MSDKKDLIRIEGQIEDVIYQNDDTGYTVCSMEWESEPVTLVGILPALAIGDSVAAMGEWVNHPTYGKQFKVHYFEKSTPQDANAMLRYLSSRAISGIGPKLAARIVDRFGEHTFDVLENNPDLLSDVQGISPRKAREVSQSFREQFGVRNVMMYFSAYFGMTTSLRIYKRWGSQSIDVVNANPYLLCDEIYGVGFERADAMAERLGMAPDGAERIRAGLHYILKYNANANGHTYLPLEKLLKTTSELLKVSEDRIGQVLSDLLKEADLICHPSARHRAVYLPEYFFAESSAAGKMVELSRISLYGAVENVPELIRQTEAVEGIRYEPKQIAAIRSAIENSVTVLTGGPGTGKTTIIKAIVNIFRLVGMDIALAAPTGRAAKRMSESTGFEAKTVHRLLEMEYSSEGKANFARNEKNLLEYDVIIVDEVSMVDTLLFSALLKAVRAGTRLVLIGDSDQLPSVGAGQVLYDTISSEAFSICRLERIFRQSGDSDIVENAHRIHRGENPVPSDKEGDFFILRRESATRVLETVLELCRERLPRRYGDEILNDLQVISCTRKGEIGTVHLNVALQSALNPPSPQKAEKEHRDRIFRVQDKVMQIRNNYDVEWEDLEAEQTGFGVFNGDIGRIESVSHAENCLTVNYDGKLVNYSFDDLDEIEHAFAVTVHKSQGSEYPVVILPVFRPPHMLATRNLLYTAVTRARNMVVLVGSEGSVGEMVQNSTRAERYTGLEEMYRIIKEKKG